MANASIISGLRPVRSAVSGHYVGAKVMAFIPASDANNMAVGDPVKLTGESNPALHGQIAGAYPAVARVTTAAAYGSNDAIWGVIDSFEPLPITGYEQVPYRLGGTAMFCHVIIDPNTEFEIQAETGTAFTGAMVGQTVDMSAALPETVYGRSQYEADLTKIGTNAGGQLLILGLQEREADNEIGALAKLRVKINKSQFSASAVAGV